MGYLRQENIAVRARVRAFDRGAGRGVRERDAVGHGPGREDGIARDADAEAEGRAHCVVDHDPLVRGKFFLLRLRPRRVGVVVVVRRRAG